MEPRLCPLCGKRLLDADENVYIALLSNKNKSKANVIIKHEKCGALVSLRFKKNTSPNVKYPIGTVVQ